MTKINLFCSLKRENTRLIEIIEEKNVGGTEPFLDVAIVNATTLKSKCHLPQTLKKFVSLKSEDYFILINRNG